MSSEISTSNPVKVPGQHAAGGSRRGVAGVPDGTVHGTSGPAWVTEERASEWRSWVAASPSAVESQIADAPFTGTPTIALPVSSRDDVAHAVMQGRLAQKSWAAKSIKERGRVLLAFHDLLMERQDEVIDLIQWETGKSRLSAWQEIGQVAALARHYARRTAHYLKPLKVRGMVPVATKVREVRAPKGVVGIISPWNYPLYLGVGDVLPALMAGNAVVSKADGQTPLTLLWTRALFAEAGLAQDLWQVVTGRGSVSGTALIDHVDYISFTGSTATGKVVASQAAGRLIGASLELGGKNPLIVRGDADLMAAAKGAATAAFANTGQMCIHIERVYVHESVYEKFKQIISEVAKAMTLGSDYAYTVHVGSLTSPEQLATVQGHIADAVSQGATVLAGGRARPEIGPLFHEPTVLEGVTPAMKVHMEETFGPVISLYPFSTDDDAVALANQGTYGLSSSVWSKDVAAAERIGLRLRAGAVNINDGAAAAAGSIEAGMGGMGESGLGRRHGAEGVRKYTNAQTVAQQRFMELGVPEGKSQGQFVEATNKQLGLMKKLGMR